MRIFQEQKGNTFSESEVERIIDLVDTNDSGLIDFTEFLVAASNEEELLKRERLENAFAYLDADKNGYITIEEIRHFLDGTEETKDELKKIFDEVDKNGDGKISKNEFLSLLINKKTWCFYSIYHLYERLFDQLLGKFPSLHWMMPTITPKSPKALPKIYTTRIFTNESGFWASAIAHPLPDTPTQTLLYQILYPQKRLEKPTEIPVQNREYPANITSSFITPLYSFTLPCRIIAMITP